MQFLLLQQLLAFIILHNIIAEYACVTKLLPLKVFKVGCEEEIVYRQKCVGYCGPNLCCHAAMVRMSAVDLKCPKRVGYEIKKHIYYNWLKCYCRICDINGPENKNKKNKDNAPKSSKGQFKLPDIVNRRD